MDATQLHDSLIFFIVYQGVEQQQYRFCIITIGVCCYARSRHKIHGYGKLRTSAPPLPPLSVYKQILRLRALRDRNFQIHTTPLSETVFSNPYNTDDGDRIFTFIQHHLRKPYFQIHTTPLTEPYLKTLTTLPYFHIHTTQLTETVFSNSYNTTYGTVFETLTTLLLSLYFHIHRAQLTETVFSNSYNTPRGDRIFKFIQHPLRRQYFQIHTTSLTDTVF